jgi:hypothetical protein
LGNGFGIGRRCFFEELCKECVDAGIGDPLEPQVLSEQIGRLAGSCVLLGPAMRCVSVLDTDLHGPFAKV